MTVSNVPPPLSTSSCCAGTWRILEMAGEVDLATAQQVQDRLIEAITGHGQPPSLVLDMTKVEFCDASGLRVLVTAHRWVQERGGRIRVVCPEGQLLRILRITQLTRLLPIYRTVDHALADQAPQPHVPAYPALDPPRKHAATPRTGVEESPLGFG